MAKWFSKKVVEDVINKSIQEEMDQFLPDNGSGWSNGSYPRKPYYSYEWQGVKRMAKDRAIRNLRKLADDNND